MRVGRPGFSAIVNKDGSVRMRVDAAVGLLNASSQAYEDFIREQYSCM